MSYSDIIKKENKYFKIENPLINIIIRTSERKNYFKQCYFTILNQTYKNIKLFITVDTLNTLKYVKNLGIQKNIFFLKKEENQNKNEYSFNLYINFILEKITQGWILILDDDDIINNIHHLNLLITIIRNINTNNIIIWKTKCKYLILPILSFQKNYIKSNDIFISSFIFHSDHKKWMKLNKKPNSFLGNLNYILKNNLLQPIWLNKIIITKTNPAIKGYGCLKDRPNSNLSVLTLQKKIKKDTILDCTKFIKTLSKKIYNITQLHHEYNIYTSKDLVKKNTKIHILQPIEKKKKNSNSSDNISSSIENLENINHEIGINLKQNNDHSSNEKKIENILTHDVDHLYTSTIIDSDRAFAVVSEESKILPMEISKKSQSEPVGAHESFGSSILYANEVSMRSDKITNKKNISNILNTIFDKIFILTLPRRKKKLNLTINRLNQHSIYDFEIFHGEDGNNIDIQTKYNEYKKQSWNHFDKYYKRKAIPSSGSYAILLGMKNLLIKCKKFKYKNILIFQDDIILHDKFHQNLTFINSYIPKNWKLLYFGGSQRNWQNVTHKYKYYLPNGTCDGAFAVGIDNSIYDELLNEMNKFNAPFDSGPLRTIQKIYKDQCFVIYPNLIIADVRMSDCRKPRDQYKISKIFRWDLESFGNSFKLEKTNIFYTMNHKNILPLISIIMTCFNSEKYIYSSIQSILNQTYTNLELIVIDDNSKDNTIEIIKEISEFDERITLIRNHKNYGTYISKNIGIKESKGTYILFNDSDDYSISTRIEKQVLFLLNNNSYGGTLSLFYSRGNNKLKPAEITLCINRNIINKIGYFDNVRIGADSEFRRRIDLFKIKIYVIKEYLYTCLDRLMECNKIGKSNSLTSNKLLGINSSIRELYRKSFIKFHNKFNFNICDKYIYPFCPIKRNFDLDSFENIEKLYKVYNFFKYEIITNNSKNNISLS